MAPAVLEAEHGTVRARSQEDAQVIVDLLVELDPRVREALGTSNGPPLVEYRLRHPHNSREAASFEGDRIVITTLPQYVPNSLAHELVHWHAYGTYWDAFPRAIQEGLATVIAFTIAPERFGGSIPTRKELRRALDVDDAEWFHRRPQEIYGIGTFVVLTVGIEGLRELALRAEREGLDQVPPEWIEAVVFEDDEDVSPGASP